MIVTRGRYLTLAEFFFDEAAKDVDADILRFMQRSEPLNQGYSTPFPTIIIDLDREESELRAELSKTNRYKIRRAEERDGFATDAPPLEVSTVHRFASFYDRFAEQKGLGRADRRRLRELCDCGMLDLSVATRPDGAELVWHAHLVVGDRARLLHSASTFRTEPESSVRNAIGRANRLLHWDDMMRFRNRRLSQYDLGGFDPGGDETAQRVSRFKEEFGGREVKTYNCAVGGSWKGRAALLMRRGRI